MKHVVKYDVYLDTLLMGSIYVKQSICLRGTSSSGQTTNPLEHRLVAGREQLWYLSLAIPQSICKMFVCNTQPQLIRVRGEI